MKQAGCLHFLQGDWEERARITRRDLKNGGGALLCVLQQFDQSEIDVGFSILFQASQYPSRGGYLWQVGPSVKFAWHWAPKKVQRSANCLVLEMVQLEGYEWFRGADRYLTIATMSGLIAPEFLKLAGLRLRQSLDNPNPFRDSATSAPLELQAWCDRGPSLFLRVGLLSSSLCFSVGKAYYSSAPLLSFREEMQHTCRTKVRIHEAFLILSALLGSFPNYHRKFSI